MVSARCPRCDDAVGLHEGRPVIAASGSVALWHARCWDAREIPVVRAVPEIEAPVVESARPARAVSSPPWRVRRRARLVLGGASVAAATVIGLVSWSARGVATSYAKADIAAIEEPAARTIATSHETKLRRVWVPTAIEMKFPMPTDGAGTALEDRFPSLRGWVHPVSKSADHVPPEAPRQFGVGRIGVEVPRPECGLGHCGIDLDGPRGRPIVAVADGEVVRVERDELGQDKISGRYVRIRHDDGTFTAYMHMDDVAEDLSPGSRIKAGQYVGTLGATAVYAAPPHLHFSLEIPTRAAPPGISVGDDEGELIFIDPAPFLARASIIPIPTDLDQFLEKPADKNADAGPKSERKHVRKPGT